MNAESRVKVTGQGCNSKNTRDTPKMCPWCSFVCVLWGVCFKKDKKASELQYFFINTASKGNTSFNYYVVAQLRFKFVKTKFIFKDRMNLLICHRLHTECHLLETSVYFYEDHVSKVLN